MRFGSIVLVDSTTFNNLARRRYMAKCDNAGNLIWATIVIGLDISSIAVNNSGLFITGDFGGVVNVGTTVLTGIYSSDIFLIKLDTSGNSIWAKSTGGHGADYSHGITTDI
jgi:hypothetical protein